MHQPRTFGANHYYLNALLCSPECRLILDKLNSHELPAYLHYHNLHHTLDVCQRAAEIAGQEGVPEEDLKLLLVAAAYHDAGYLQQAHNHEQISCAIARQYLPAYGYSAGQLQTICGIIMATRIPQAPHTHLEQIMCDADVDYLGRDDFFSLGQGLYQEMLYRGIVKNGEEWDALQINFLENHSYFTPTAIAERGAKKEEHLSILKKKTNKI